MCIDFGLLDPWIIASRTCIASAQHSGVFGIPQVNTPQLSNFIFTYPCMHSRHMQIRNRRLKKWDRSGLAYLDLAHVGVDAVALNLLGAKIVQGQC